ncbi:hypothetical protein [Blastococcus sp. TF02A-26]|uniref:hypothetical protein n=1 Tax=Blastococcus sp. TF02A-26 TaxID=2250577 RepID=UPI000DEBBB36|nr:hypothetical protein [Blastococcus sp. TF02A-26]RBY85170.1 hypothetical protein DQ240_13175 [Blastococcus sp. TF02A-26]
MRRVWGVVLAAVLAVAAGCGSDSGEAAAPASVGLSPPGTPLVGGLVVPVGTHLVGPVFPDLPHPLARYDRQVAVLQIDGDPFAAWDDLAGQAQDMGLPVAASGVCTWLDSRYLATPVTGPAPATTAALDCRGGGHRSLQDGPGVGIAMRMWWWDAGAELHVDYFEGDLGDLFSGGPTTGDPGPAPATAADRLPKRDAPVAVEIGEPFGRENNCFESGYDRLTLPAGARLVGGGTTPGSTGDFAAVLAVEDPRAVLGALRDQLDGPDSSFGNYGLDEVALADGTLVWSLTGGVEAGGGGCSMWSSPDGTAVLVTTSSD